MGLPGPGESACGLIPGLRAPGPLGRKGRRFAARSPSLAATERTSIFLPSRAPLALPDLPGDVGGCSALGESASKEVVPAEPASLLGTPGAGSVSRADPGDGAGDQ